MQFSGVEGDSNTLKIEGDKKIWINKDAHVKDPFTYEGHLFWNQTDNTLWQSEDGTGYKAGSWFTKPDAEGLRKIKEGEWDCPPPQKDSDSSMPLAAVVPIVLGFVLLLLGGTLVAMY